VRGHLGETLGLLQEATRLQPENAEAWFRLGEFDFRVRNCPRAALPELERFTELNPQDPGNVEYDRALALVNSGKPVC
jgi:tetratricopeptide (TPR) repeat protein